MERENEYTVRTYSESVIALGSLTESTARRLMAEHSVAWRDFRAENEPQVDGTYSARQAIRWLGY